MNNDNMLTAKHQSTYLAERLLIAYYASNDTSRAWHVAQAHEALKQAAAAMGYTLEPIALDDEQAA